MELKTIVQSIKKEQPEIKNVFFVGCGASKAELYPAKYFLESKTKRLHVGHFTSNEFVYATPAMVGSSSIVIACSLGGATPETVEAAKKAKSLGAHVITVTNRADSPLASCGQYTVIHDWAGSYSNKMRKMGKVLGLAIEILTRYEGYAAYEKAMDGIEKTYDLIDKAVAFVGPSAEQFAAQYKDAPVIYVMSSGATAEVAYSFSICLLLEMQWINSGSFHNGEYFHGPFEITSDESVFLLLMNEGRTRALDVRALEFLNRFGKHNTIIDAKDFGLGGAVDDSIAEFVNPMLISAILRVYAEKLAIARNHPLTMRRYMWKMEY